MDKFLIIILNKPSTYIVHALHAQRNDKTYFLKVEIVFKYCLSAHNNEYRYDRYIS